MPRLATRHKRENGAPKTRTILLILRYLFSRKSFFQDDSDFLIWYRSPEVLEKVRITKTESSIEVQLKNAKVPLKDVKIIELVKVKEINLGTCVTPEDEFNGQLDIQIRSNKPALLLYPLLFISISANSDHPSLYLKEFVRIFKP